MTDMTPSDLEFLDDAADEASWRWWVGTLAGAFLGAVLIVALFPKASDPWAFQGVIENQGLDFLFPARVVAFLGLAAEAVLGFALLFFIRRAWVLWPSVLLVAFFLFLTGRHYYLHAHGLAAAGDSCGCFGDLITRTPAEAFWQDLLLLVPPLLFAFVGRPTSTRPQPWKRITLIVGLSVGALAYAATVDRPEPLLRLEAKPGALCVQPGEGEPLCLDAVIPELADAGSDHLILMIALDDPGLLERLGDLGAYADAMAGPTLWVLSPTGDEKLEAFQFTHQPMFALVAAPAVLVDALSPDLPVSFRVRDGRVTALWQGWPPLEALGSDDPGDEDGGNADGRAMPGDTDKDADTDKDEDSGQDSKEEPRGSGKDDSGDGGAADDKPGGGSR